MTEYPTFGETAPIRSVGIGEALCVEGDDGSDVFRVESGSFVIERSTLDGAMVVGTVGPGELVGEVVSALGGLRTATVRATEPSTVAVFTQSEFYRWLHADDEVSSRVAAEARRRSNRSRASAVLANLFGLENQSVVDAVVDQISWRTLSPGEVLFTQGSEADAAYLVLAGRVQVLARDVDGHVAIDVELGRGELVGELGILDDSPRSATVSAMRETTLAMISRQAFESLTTQHPSLILKVFLTIIDRVMHRVEPDSRARVVSVVSTVPNPPADHFAPFVEAISEHGSTLRLSSANLGNYVREIDGLGGSERVAAFLHEADVANDYVVLEGDSELTDWTVSAALQSDRCIVFMSAAPDAEEQRRVRLLLDLLSDAQRSNAWVVRVFRDSANPPRGSAEILDRFEVDEVHNVVAGNGKHMARMGRLATGNGRGVVLGGGGAKGFAHIGALRALHEAGLEYDRIGGASMGAIVGAMAAKDLRYGELLAMAQQEFHKDLLDYTVPLVSLLKAEKMAEGFMNQFGGWDIADLWIPFYCVTTNITTAELGVHRRGDLGRAVRASSAIPVALPPVPIDGHLHVDGGVLDNVPIRTMWADNSIGTVIAVDVSPPGGPTADTDFGLSVSGFDELKRRLRRNESPYPDIGTTLMSSMLIGSSAAKASSASSGMADLYIDLDLDGVGLLKFENHEAVAERGYVGAREAIAAWQAESSDEVIDLTDDASAVTASEAP